MKRFCLEFFELQKELFFKRVLYHSENTIQQLLIKTESKADVQEKIQKLSKLSIEKALSEYPKLFVKRNVYQIIICTIYAVCKIIKSKLFFQELLEALKKCFPDFYPTAFQIYLNENQKGDIINFYNIVYLKSMKPHYQWLKTLKVDSDIEINEILKNASELKNSNEKTKIEQPIEAESQQKGNLEQDLMCTPVRGSLRQKKQLNLDKIIQKYKVSLLIVSLLFKRIKQAQKQNQISKKVSDEKF